jgi:exodeoxyribonuclease V alpha subunit
VLKPLAAGAPLRAFFLDGNAVRSVGVSRLANVETAFAMTVHKSQGSEFEHTVLVLPQEASQVLTRELVYTGITRARQAFTLVTGRPHAFAQALAQRTRRASGLLELLEGGAEAGKA